MIVDRATIGMAIEWTCPKLLYKFHLEKWVGPNWWLGPQDHLEFTFAILTAKLRLRCLNFNLQSHSDLAQLRLNEDCDLLGLWARSGRTDDQGRANPITVSGFL